MLKNIEDFGKLLNENVNRIAKAVKNLSADRQDEKFISLGETYLHTSGM